jgi:bifunctional DNA-binding transcriptional regulator/antitoxin component of YhaV-PrlF toxin-antitoxin module
MAELIKMDKNGRVVIPGKFRKRFNTTLFTLDADENRIELRPVMTLSGLFGSIPELDLERIRQEHDAEVRDEDTTSAD